MPRKRHYKGLTTQGYAEHSGLSYSHVQRLKRDGKVKLHPEDGSIDAEATDLLRQREAASEPFQPVPREAVSEVAGALRAIGVDVSPDSEMTYLEARTAHEILKAAERKIRVAILEGRFVEVDAVRKEFFRLARESRDAWMNWPNRVSAVMAAEFGIDPAAFHAALLAAVRDHQAELADPKSRLF